MCNQCIAASGVPGSFPSVIFFVVCLPKNRVVVLQFRLTPKSLPHFNCHVISLVGVIGFNLYNRCDSRTDNRTKPIMFNSCDTERYHCRMTAVAAVALCDQSPRRSHCVNIVWEAWQNLRSQASYVFLVGPRVKCGHADMRICRFFGPENDKT